RAAPPSNRARPASVARNRRAHLSSRSRARAHPKRDHELEDVGGLLQRSRLALWWDGPEGIVNYAAVFARTDCAGDRVRQSLQTMPADETRETCRCLLSAL